MKYPHLLATSAWLAGLACIVGGIPQWAWPFTFISGFALARAVALQHQESK
jgi:hypothetical protein